MEEKEKAYLYDVFIPCADSDWSWVKGEILPRLKCTCLRVCTRQNFDPGASRITEVERLIKNSRKTLLILTQAYLEGEWNNYVSVMVKTLDPAGKDRRLIPFLKETCEIPLYIRELTSVNFVDPDEREWAWTQLLTALGAPPLPQAPDEPTREKWLLAHPYGMPPNFTGRKEEREMLSQWLSNDSAHPLLVISALGGFGKSALAWHWLLHDVDPVTWPKVLWWSFYESEASFESLLAHILAYFGLKSSSVPSREWVDQVVAFMHQPGILLIMDGFERALRAYSSMNAVYQGDTPSAHQGNRRRSSGRDKDGERDCVSPLAESFLRAISCLPGIRSKVLITTRLRPKILEAHGHELLEGCREEELTHMQPADAVSFFYAQGIRGTRAEIEGVCKPYGYHPLSLRLLAGLIAKDFQKAGDIAVARRLDVSGDLIQRKHHVLEQSYEILTAGVRTLLGRVACFRGPVGYNALATLGKDASPPVDVGLCELTSRGLIHHDRTFNRFDLHPIVRRYAYDRLTEKERNVSHTRLRDYFAAVPAPASIKSLDDLAPVIELYHHTVRAGMYDEARDIFRDRISKPTYFQFGAYNLTIELLRSLFPDGEKRPPRLKSERNQSWTLNELANNYSLSGQPKSALGLYEKANTIKKRLGDKKNHAIGLSNLAYMAQLPLSMLKEAERNLRLSLTLSQEIEDEFNEGVAQNELGRVLAFRGAWSESEKALSRALEIWLKQKYIQGRGLLCTHRALRALLLARTFSAGKVSSQRKDKIDSLNKEALYAAKKALDLADKDARTDCPVERDYIRAHWLLGTAHVLIGHPDEADHHLSQALTRCRRINLIEMEADILIGLAGVRKAAGNREEAHSLAQDALLITERSEFVLQGADVHLFLARLILESADSTDVNNKESALSHAKKALALATCDGPPDYTYKVAYEEAKALISSLA